MFLFTLKKVKGHSPFDGIVKLYLLKTILLQHLIALKKAHR